MRIYGFEILGINPLLMNLSVVVVEGESFMSSLREIGLILV